MRKLKETLVTVQQLDKNMSNLRTWLSRIEAELAKPVVYSVCHSDEIQRKLEEQQVGTDRRERTPSVTALGGTLEFKLERIRPVMFCLWLRLLLSDVTIIYLVFSIFSHIMIIKFQVFLFSFPIFRENN